MTEKTKKALVIAAGSVACIALAVGIAMRFGGNAKAPQGEIPSSSDSGSSSIIVDIDKREPTHTPEIDTSKPDTAPEPGAGADSTGTQQTIQADPVKPEVTEPPAPELPEGEDATPEPVTPERPGSDEPAPGSTNQAGQVYVPGFGYVDKGGANTTTQADDMYENGNKIGEMG